VNFLIPGKSFVMLVGPTGCGKTTFREQNLSALACVCPDSFIIGPWTPKKVSMAWDYAEGMSNILFQEGTSFLFDAQFVKESTRRYWQEKARRNGFAPGAFIFDTPWEQIQQNQAARGTRGTYGMVPLCVQETNFSSFRTQKEANTLATGFDWHIWIEWGKDSSYKGT
jgi:predicted kinase